MADATTAADYLWLDEHYPQLTEAYCVALVRGTTPRALLDRLGGTPKSPLRGVEALCEWGYDEQDLSDAGMPVGLAPVGDDWTLMLEANGYLGVTGAAMLPVSQGTTVVSHFRNVNAVDRFHWFEDGDERLHFEPLFAHERHGSHPDELVPLMREVGFELSERDDRDRPRVHTEAAFALAERITGIRLTPELFASQEFLCAVAPLPRSRRTVA